MCSPLGDQHEPCAVAQHGRHRWDEAWAAAALVVAEHALPLAGGAANHAFLPVIGLHDVVGEWQFAAAGCVAKLAAAQACVGLAHAIATPTLERLLSQSNVSLWVPASVRRS